MPKIKTSNRLTTSIISLKPDEKRTIIDALELRIELMKDSQDIDVQRYIVKLKKLIKKIGE